MSAPRGTGRRTLVFVLLGAAAVATLLYLRGRAPTAPSAAVKIGVVLPFTGSMAPFAENARNGLVLAHEQAVRAGKPSVKLIFQDDLGTPTGMVTAVRRLIDVEGVRFIIGGLTSSGVLAAAPYAQQRGVLFFSPAASAPGIPEIGDLVFRNWQSDDSLASLFGAAAAGKLGLKKLIVVGVGNDYGKTNSDAFSKAFEAAGGSVLARRTVSEGAAEAQTVAAFLGSADEVDGVLLALYPEEYKSVLGAWHRPASGGPKLLATDTFYAEDLLKDLGRRAEGTTIAIAAKPSEDYAPRQQFAAAYRERFTDEAGKAKEPGLVSDTAYDAFNLVLEGLTATQPDPAQVAQWLLRQHSWPGAAGIVDFTETGDVRGGMALFRVVEGKFVPADK